MSLKLENRTLEKFRQIVHTDTLRRLANKALSASRTKLEDAPKSTEAEAPHPPKSEPGRHTLTNTDQLTVESLGASKAWYGTGATRHAKPEITHPNSVVIPDVLPPDPHYLDLGEYTPKNEGGVNAAYQNTEAKPQEAHTLDSDKTIQS